MKEASSQEVMSDPSHSCISEGSGCSSSGNSFKSAAMLGIALSVGASGVLVSQADASAAVSTPSIPATTETFSSDSKVSATSATFSEEGDSQNQVVAYHTVESGESLWQIAQQNRVGLRELKETNALPVETAIRVGQVLKIPASTAAPVGATTELIASITADDAAGIQKLASGNNSENSTSVQADSAPQHLSQLSTDGTASATVIAQAVETPTSQTSVSQASSVGSLQVAERADSSTRSISAQSPDAQSAISIQIADASTQQRVAAGSTTAGSATVVTALATPSNIEQYRVQVGDTLNTIAASFGTTSEALIRANRLANPNVIFAGAVLRVPSTESANNLSRNTPSTSAPSARPLSTSALESKSQQSLAVSNLQRSNGEQLAYLRSTATRPEAARILEDLRNASPEEPVSVGGEQVTAENLLLSAKPAQPESIDPYVTDLLEDVQEIRNEPVAVSEVETTERDATQVASADSVTERRSLLSRSEASIAQPNVGERVALSVESSPSAANSSLLAAAPLSPEAYIPAQRSAEPQVVSPDMPILPSADEFLPEAPNYFDGYIWPAQGTVTSGYGWRWGRMHRGVDVAGPVGTPIVAAAAGIVEQAGWNSGGYGNIVEIRHPDGSMTRYAHNSRLNVSTGQSVRQGELIAEMGSTGYSTGPHLHFEVHPEGSGAVNPVAFLPSR